MEHPDSEPLLVGLAAGDAEAFGALYARRLCFSITHQHCECYAEA
jgi:hypothetical protein